MYTFRLPFELPDGYEINNADKTIIQNGLRYKLKKETRLYALVVEGFETEDQAKSFLANSWSGLTWVLLNCGLASRFELELQEISNTKRPKKAAKNLSKNLGIELEDEIQGIIHGTYPAAFNSSNNYKCLTMGKANLIAGVSIDRFYEFFFSGANKSFPENGLNDRKLIIALELYSAFFSETTPNAKFLTLVMVLETLSSSQKRPPLVLNLLSGFRKKIEEMESNNNLQPTEATSLESLKRELEFREEDSIRTQIRTLVSNVLSDSGDTDALKTAKQAVKIYDKRSTLIHTGYLPSTELGSLISDVRKIVEKVLKARFLNSVGT